MQFPSNKPVNPAHGRSYRQAVDTIDKFTSWVPGLPKLWGLFWKAGKVVRPSEFSKLESEAKTATKAYMAIVPLWESVSQNLGVIERNLRRGGGLGWGTTAATFETTWNYHTLNQLKSDIASLRDELERYLGALETCELAVQKKAAAETFWRELGQAEMQLKEHEEQLRRLHAEALRRG